MRHRDEIAIKKIKKIISEMNMGIQLLGREDQENQQESAGFLCNMFVMSGL